MRVKNRIQDTYKEVFLCESGAPKIVLSHFNILRGENCLYAAGRHNFIPVFLASLFHIVKGRKCACFSSKSRVDGSHAARPSDSDLCSFGNPRAWTVLWLLSKCSATVFHPQPRPPEGNTKRICVCYDRHYCCFPKYFQFHHHILIWWSPMTRFGKCLLMELNGSFEDQNWTPASIPGTFSSLGPQPAVLQTAAISLVWVTIMTGNGVRKTQILCSKPLAVRGYLPLYHHQVCLL